MDKEIFIFAESAGRHGFTVEDVVYAFEHHTNMMQHTEETGALKIAFVGPCLQPLVDYIEVIMIVVPDSKIVVIHVQSLTDNFRHLLER